MKTLKTVCIALMCVAFAACTGSNPTPAEVAAKIDSHETLSQKDYEVMIDYCGDYARDAQQYFNIINMQPSDSTAEYARAAQDLANLKADSPYLDMFRTAIYAATDEQIGEKNSKKVEEYQQYEAFPLPEGSGPDLAFPGEMGTIVEMPDTDTTAVIAAGDGVAVEPDASKAK